MYTEKDLESINKSADGAALLSADLRAMISADDPLLGEIALAMVNEAQALSNQLERIRHLMTRGDEATALPNETAERRRRTEEYPGRLARGEE